MDDAAVLEQQERELEDLAEILQVTVEQLREAREADHAGQAAPADDPVADGRARWWRFRDGPLRRAGLSRFR